MLAAGRLDGSPRRNVKYERRPARAQPPVNTRDVTNAGLQLQRRAGGGRGWRGWCLRPRGYLLRLLNVAAAKVTV